MLIIEQTAPTDSFDYSEAIEALPNSSKSALKELLNDMVKRGLLMRLKKGQKKEGNAL